MEQQFFNWFGELLVAGGGGALVAYGIFKWLGATWIESKFAKSLEAMRQAHAKELAELTVRWDASLQSRLKYQEREFTAVGESWRLLQEAFGLVQWGTSAFQQYADIERLSDRQLNEFLDGSEFADSQKAALRELSGRLRQDHYTELVNRQRISRVQGGITAFATYVNENFPFIPEGLFDEFEAFIPVMWRTIVKVRVGREANDYKMVSEATTDTAETLTPQFEAVKASVRAYMNQIRDSLSQGASSA